MSATSPSEQTARHLADVVNSTPVAAESTRAAAASVGPAAIAEPTIAAAPPIVGDALSAPGRPLDATTRAFFEPRFGLDLGEVRVHTDARAAASARAIQARAYAAGNDVVFGAGQFAPERPEGRGLLAHEIAHVVGGSPATIHRSEIEGASQTPEAGGTSAAAAPIEVPAEVSPESEALARDTAAAIDDAMARGWGGALENETVAVVLALEVEKILEDTFERSHSWDPQLRESEAPLLQYFVAQHPGLRERLALLRLRAGADVTGRIERYLGIPMADPGRFTYQIFMAGVGGGELVEGVANYVSIRYLERGQPVWTRRFLFLAIGGGGGIAPVVINADWGWNGFTAPEYWEPADFGGGTMAVVGAGFATIGPPKYANGAEIEHATIYGDGNHLPIDADIGGQIWGTPEAGASAVYGILIPFSMQPAPGPGHGVLPPRPGFVQRPVVRQSFDIEFETGEAELDIAAHIDLTSFVEEFRDVLTGGDFTLTLIGHASRTGSAATNQRLSEERRAAVRKGIESRLGVTLDDDHVAGDAFGEQLAELEGLDDSDNSARFRSVQVILVGVRTRDLAP